MRSCHGFLHPVEASGHFKRTLGRGICLIVPDAVVRRLCRFAVIVDSLIAVDVNGHNDLFYRIRGRLSLIAFRLLIEVFFVRREGVCLFAQKIETGKLAGSIAFCRIICDIFAGADAFCIVLIDHLDRLNVVSCARINFQIICVKGIRRQIQGHSHGSRRVQRSIPHIVIGLVLLSGKCWLCSRQVASGIAILTEIHRKRAYGLIADLQLGVIGTVAPHSIFREQITVTAVHMAVGSDIFCRLCIILANVFQ